MPYLSKIAKLKRFAKHNYKVCVWRFFNTTVVRQRKNPKAIPIIIINFNQLHYLRLLIGRLQTMRYSNLIIVDNNSTYEPLFNYYKSIETDVTIHKLKTNNGHLSFWKQPDLVKKYTKGYYVVTDPDILLIDDCPSDFMSTFIRLLDRAYDRTKVGFSLKIDDLPNTNPKKKSIEEWESQFWKTKIHPLAFKAEIDTTFALYRPGYKYKLKDFTKAWRTDYPLQAIHGGWYINPTNLTKEQAYYQKTANSSASWLIDEEGGLKHDEHKTIYPDK